MLATLGAFKAFGAFGAFVLAGLAALASGGGCVPVDGGAVEARWELRRGPVTFPMNQGEHVSCQEAKLAQMVFRLEPLAPAAEDPCAGSELCRFPCSPPVGTTGFVIPEGTYAISLAGIDPQGGLVGQAEGLIAPPPVVREVRIGELTDLNVNLIIVERK